jgi:beta-phosphoglucomutase
VGASIAARGHPAPSALGVIFDMDGVLADTAQAHFRSWQVVAGTCGVPITWGCFLETFGRPNREIIGRLLGRTVSEEEISRLDDLKESAFRQVVREELKPVPGARELVEVLCAGGFRVGLGSSGPPENIAVILEALGLADCFQAIVSARDVRRGKPAADVFLAAAAMLGLPPGRCLVVEDVPAGIEAAHAAGMKAVAVTTTHPASQLAGADLVLRDLTEIGPDRVVRLIGGGGTQGAGGSASGWGPGESAVT